MSRRAIETAGLDVEDGALRQAPVKGRTEPVEFYIFKEVPELPL